MFFNILAAVGKSLFTAYAAFAALFGTPDLQNGKFTLLSNFQNNLFL